MHDRSGSLFDPVDSVLFDPVDSVGAAVGAALGPLVELGRWRGGASALWRTGGGQ